MALTKNSKMVQARKKAQKLAQAARERETKLVELATQYFVEQANSDEVKADAAAVADELVRKAQLKAEEIVTKAEDKAMKHDDAAEALVVKMLDTGAAVADAAARTELKVSAVKRIVAAHAAAKQQPELPQPQTPGSATLHSVPDPDVDSDAAEAHSAMAV